MNFILGIVAIYKALVISNNNIDEEKTNCSLEKDFLFNFPKQALEVFYKKVVLENFVKFRGNSP